MLFQRIVSEGIAHNSYLIGSSGQAAVIDPRRDYGIYLEIARENDMVISHIFETHRNEDYVIGSVGLAARCGAEIYHGANGVFSYGRPVWEGDTFAFGSLELSIIETPGHTEESISLVLTDRDVSHKPYIVFTGDTLFSGDIARTDFYGQKRKAEMAGKIFDSIYNKILPLGDGVLVCPAHGAGSICGGEITDHPFTTIGYEKKTNKCILGGRETFIAGRVRESPHFPPYFEVMKNLNTVGAVPLNGISQLRPLTVSEVNTLVASGSQILDLRAPTSFGAGHIPGSISIWRGGLSAFIGWVFTYDLPIVLIDDFNLSLETVHCQMLRLGYDNIAGYFAGGFPRWTTAAQEIATLSTCSVQQLNEYLKVESPFLLDVRDKKTWDNLGHIPGAHHLYVGELASHFDEIPRDRSLVIYCDAGFKGSLAASILARYGYRSLTNVLGGMNAWKRAGFRLEK